MAAVTAPPPLAAVRDTTLVDEREGAQFMEFMGAVTGQKG